MNSKDYRKIISDKLNNLLKERQFKKKGSLFSFSNGDLIYFIEIQSSESSTSDVLRVTVNTEIASALISKLDDISLPVEQQRHYSRRIGTYLDDKQDKWWTVDSLNSAEIAANEIVGIINDKVIPDFNVLRTTNDLASLWKNGVYIGITEKQKRNYLHLLENAQK